MHEETSTPAEGLLEAKVRFQPADASISAMRAGESIVHMPMDDHSCYVVLHAPSRERLDALVAMIAETTATDAPLSQAPGSEVYACHCASHGPVGHFKQQGIYVKTPITFHSGYKFYHLLVRDRSELRRAMAYLEARGTIRLEFVRPAKPEAVGFMVNAGDLMASLSPRQRMALRVAHEAGYYETPRRASLDALARSVGLSDSTFHEHLTKAERAIIDTMARLWRQYPALSPHADSAPAPGEGG